MLGGGHAGVLAALGASDNGAKVAVIEKQPEKAFDDYWGRIGEDIGHVNSKWLIKRGCGPYNTGEITAEFVKRAGGRCNPDVIRLFVENSGAMFDRMVEVYEECKVLRKTHDSAAKFKYSDGVTETYDFSNVMSAEMLINQVQKGVAPKDYPIELSGVFSAFSSRARQPASILSKPLRRMEGRRMRILCEINASDTIPRVFKRLGMPPKSSRPA